MRCSFSQIWIVGTAVSAWASDRDECITAGVEHGEGCINSARVEASSLLQVARDHTKISKSVSSHRGNDDFKIYYNVSISAVDCKEFHSVASMQACNTICSKYEDCFAFIFEHNVDADGNHKCLLAPSLGSQGGLYGNPNWDVGIPHDHTTTTTTTTAKEGFYTLKYESSSGYLCVAERNSYIVMLPCEAGDDMLWQKSSFGYFTNKGSGKCIGFGKKGASTKTLEGILANRFVAVELHDDSDDHDHDECARPSSPPFDSDTLSIPDCDTEMAAFGFKMPCQVHKYKDPSGNYWLVAYAPYGRMVPFITEEAPAALLQMSSSSAGKVCPTLGQVAETPLDKRWSCWDAKNEHWWNRCAFNFWAGECGGNTQIPCHIFKLDDISAECLLYVNVTTEENVDSA